MAKHIIVMHGRNIKPDCDGMNETVKNSLLEGLERAGKQDAHQRLKNGSVKLSVAYYGDILNRVLQDNDPQKYKGIFDSQDPKFRNGPCLDSKHIRDAFSRTVSIRPFNKSKYEAVLRAADDLRFLDEAADFAGFLGTILGGGWLTQQALHAILPDFRAYYDDDDVGQSVKKYLGLQSVGSAIRERLGTLLTPSLLAGDDVCLITHSMGCVVAYDTLWKYSHMSEYREFRLNRRSNVDLWMTIGCPLGEPGIRRLLLGAGHFFSKPKYPEGMVREWQNYHARDDYVSRVEKMRPEFKDMFPSASHIKDNSVYNCWIYKHNQTGRIISNPHSFYGYLMQKKLGQRLGDWL